MKLDSNGFPSAFNDEQLVTITKSRAEARQGACDRQDTEFGDDAQVLGIRAYKNAVKSLVEYSELEEGENLEITDPSGRCTLVIEDCAVRFWKSNDPDNEVEEKRLILSPEATQQMSLLNDPLAIVDRWGLLYQTDTRGLFLSALLVGFNSATRQVMKRKDIRLGDSPSVKIADIKDELPQAVPVANGASVIKLKGQNKTSSTSEGSNG